MPRPPPMLMPIIGAHRPTVSDIRAPWISRASSSRPSPSVPSQCARLGSARRSNMSMSVGPCASSRSAKIAATPMNAIHVIAIQNSVPTRRLRLIGLTATVSMPRSSVAMTDPRIEHGIEQVDDEIHDDEAPGHEQHHALQDDQVAGVDRADQQTAEPGQGKNRLHDDGAADQPPDIDPGDGDKGKRRGL